MAEDLNRNDALITATQAAIDAALGEHQPTEAVALIQTLSQTPDLPANFQTYLRHLAQAVTQPEKDHFEVLALYATNLLETPETRSIRLTFALNVAQFFGAHQWPQVSLIFQRIAIDWLRQASEDSDVLQMLGTTLFNQAFFLAQLGQYDEAVIALEEVVDIDRKLALPDLADDEAALAQMRQRRDEAAALAANQGEPIPLAADLPPEAAVALEEKLAAYPPEERAQIRENVARFMALSAEEQAEVVAAEELRRIEAEADQIVTIATDAWRNKRVADLLPLLEEAADKLAQDRDPDSPPAQLKKFVRAVIALLQGQPLPPVPQVYRARMRQLRQQIR